MIENSVPQHEILITCRESPSELFHNLSFLPKIALANKMEWGNATNRCYSVQR